MSQVQMKPSYIPIRFANAVVDPQQAIRTDKMLLVENWDVVMFAWLVHLRRYEASQNPCLVTIGRRR
jgi:hypothetical protein